MVRDIDDLADERATGIQSTGEEYRETFLRTRPKTEWSPYIDETAKDLSAGIQIADLDLTRNNFGREVGPYYRRGLKQTAGRYADLPEVLENEVSDENLGLLAYQLNELSYEISHSDIGIQDVEEATEAVIEKLLTRYVGSDLSVSFNITGGNVADITTQLFNTSTVASHVDLLLNKIEESASQGLLSLMDEPQMMTPLWAHQRDALRGWVAHDYRGYVDMATATGKTVLGLGALALRYGELHPDDDDIEELGQRRDASGSDDVLIVAHSELILEQWRREFDRHLNIPRERTTGSDDISLQWGTVHFRTPQALVNEDRITYDLVLLDEAHHYATGAEWGSLLDEFDADVLAMSGSVDDAGTDSERIKDRLTNSIGPEIKRYTITDAKANGVIPSFDWEVHYAPYDASDDELKNMARRTETAFDQFQKKLDNGEILLDTDRHLETYEDIRRFSHTSEGNELKQENEAFRDLVTRLFSRRTKRWNLSPVLESVVDLVVDHSTNEKVVVLADSNAQVEELDSRLHNVIPESTPIYRVTQSQDQSKQRETIDEFDEPESAGILIGTGDLLGEGVDMQHASVAINMATGGVNPELVQRIGRVLRNPVDTPKHAMFYNVVGVPSTIDSAVPSEDGKRIIEHAAGFCSLGRRFDKLPGFSTAASLDTDAFGSTLEEGASFMQTLEADGMYQWGGDTVQQEDLDALYNIVRSTRGDGETILGEWEEYAWEHSSEDVDLDSQTAQTETATNTSGSDDTREQPPDKPREKGADADSDESDLEKDRIRDIVKLQPTETSELGTRWALPAETDVETYLHSDLSEYHFRDGDGLIWASDKAEKLINGVTSTATDGEESVDTSEDGRPSEGEVREDLIEDIHRVEATLDEVPSKGDMEERGEHPIEQYEEAFGTWSDAVRAAGFEPRGTHDRQYTREDVLEGLREVTAMLGDPPSVTEINEHADFSVSVVYNYFDSLDDAHDAVKSEESGSDSPRPSGAEDGTEDDPSSPGDAEHAVSPEDIANPLSEYYESLRNYRSLLESLIEREESPYTFDGDQPINEWLDAIEDVVFGSGLDDAHPGYGEQQGNRNPVTMGDYRDVFGNGDTITDYQCIDTTLVTREEVTEKFGYDVDCPSEIYVPKSPETGSQLPLVVPSEEVLETALGLLEEFPPAPEPSIRPYTGAETETDNSSSTESDAGDSGTESAADASETVSASQEDSGSSEPTGEQEVFWDRNNDTITEYADVDAQEAEGDGVQRDSLDKKIDEWKSQLLDLTRRNNLIAFRATKTKSLPFDDADPTIIATELDDGNDIFIRKRPEETDGTVETNLADDELLPTRQADEADSSLYQIGLKNKQYLRERGVDTLYLALGMLRWYSADHSDEVNRSPLFLAPVELVDETQSDETRHDYVIQPKADELRLNPALRKKLAAEHGVTLPADSALTLSQIDAAFEAAHDSVRGFNRWTIEPDVVLGIFDFTKYSLYADLERNRDKIKSDPIIRALNGEVEPLQAAEGDVDTPAARELDDVVDPVDMYQVLDADSSQQEAIEAAKRGKSFVLQGPPGTGKSQTIANIIAEKLAAGERVLFVSEKQAALNVVKNRLDDVGLGRFCLEVHGAKANNADVLSSLEDELKAGQVKPPAKRQQRLTKLRERQDTINDYGDQLFYSPDGWDLTAYEAFGIVSLHSDAPRVPIGMDDPLAHDEVEATAAVDQLQTLTEYGDEIDAYDSNPWRHTTLTQWGIDTGDSIRRSLRRQQDAIEQLEATADALDANLGIRPRSLAEYNEVQSLLEHLQERPAISWQEEFFDDSFPEDHAGLEKLAELEQDRASLMAELSTNYQRSFFSANGAELNNDLAGYGLLKPLKSSYRSLKRQITNHAKEEYDPGHEQLLEDTRKLSEIQHLEERRDDYQGVIERLGPLYEGEDTDWDTITEAQSWVADFQEYDTSLREPVGRALLSNSLPEIAPLLEETTQALDHYREAAAFFENAMAVDDMTVNQEPFREADFSAVSDKLDLLQETVPRLQRRVHFESQLADVRETLVGDYVDEFLTRTHGATLLVPAFKKEFYTQWLNRVYDHTDLGSFSADEIERYLTEFRELDKEQQELAKIEIQHQVTKQRPTLDLEHATSSEQVTVRREIEKQRRHKPLRELFEETGSYITKLTPCFMMSPLSVAQYLKTESVQFDTVIFDEASQIMPHDAISSLIRADQAVIAGDTKQLPPTSFFQSDVETTEDVREDLDSILEETASVLSEKNLRWHYRSRTKDLIEFSNYHYYNNDLRTFPENQPDVETGVEFEYVSDGIYDRGGSRQNEIEAGRVIDLIETHAENHSEKSLGVVAFSSAQEQAIRDALDERREDNVVLDAFVGQDDVLDEFFIKNLEMVQGDERDRMIFSVGYGPDTDGIMSMNFGPLNKTGGERRLNVAVTRAKEKVTIVSSIQPGDVDLTRTNSTGVEHFKNYLEYAKNGEQALARDDAVTQTLDFDSTFEEAVYDALTDDGYDVVPQVESSSYSIDLAIKHPDKPGEFILGIECDGAAYHSSKTARDRDRTRQLVLENLGWTIHRIWSPDWSSNREREIEKINDKIDDLLQGEAETTDDIEWESYEPEVIEVASKTDHEEIVEFEDPSLQFNQRYVPNDASDTGAIRNSLNDVIQQYAPLKRDAAFRGALDVWSESRLGKNVRQSFRHALTELKRSGGAVEHDGFVWPPRSNFELKIRTNTDTADRSIDEIPLEEIGRALCLILQEGGEMSEDDLQKETSFLFGFQRRGERIQDRTASAVSMLKDADVIETTEAGLRLDSESNPNVVLLDRIYA